MNPGEVLWPWACPRCGNADVDTLRIRDDADVEGDLDDEDLDRETIWCERCGLRYRLP